MPGFATFRIAANEWTEDIRRRKLPVVLTGPAATYYEALPAEDASSLDKLLTSLQQCSSPSTGPGRHYRKFEDDRLRPIKDVWKINLRKAPAEERMLLFVNALSRFLHVPNLRSVNPAGKGVYRVKHPY